MIRVTVELVPYGIEEDARVIATMKIANDGIRSRLTNGKVGDYNVYVTTVNKRGGKCRDWKTGEVKNFPRKSKNVWYLIKRALDAILGP